MPYGDDTGLSEEPLLWQAQSDFRVRMVSAAMYTAGPDGAIWYGAEGTALSCAMHALQSTASIAGCGPNLIDAARGDLAAVGVSVIIMGPMAYGTEPELQKPMEDFLIQLAGAPPRLDQGALVWSYPG